MAFSWKKAKKRGIAALKARRQIHLKNGQNVKADDCKRKIERMEK